MDLKDLFAAHVAAALASKPDRPDVIAARAYELAEALLRERVRRAPSDDDELFVSERADGIGEEVPDDELFRSGSGLLDEPAPWRDREGLEVDPSWLDRDGDPRWEVEPKWGPGSDRPGLARTLPAAAEDDKKRRPA
ncbi:MAG: hypothetical protein IPG04_04770 [Polyangiaceae bacterium]|nr:hypothetical protein [Polyangiaceae bacterium]